MRAKTLFLEDKNLSYLIYLTTLVDLSKIKSIYDFGGGDGDLGYALKRKFSQLQLFYRKYSYCEKNLEERGYTNFKVFDEIKQNSI